MSVNSKNTSVRPSGFLHPLQSNRGFTLIELIVVCAILGILATLAMSSIADFRQKVKIARAAAEIRGLEKDIISYASEKGSYPTDEDAPGMENLRDLKDPWGNSYVYTLTPVRSFVTPINTDFDLYSKGPTGISTIDSDPSIELGNGADDIIRGGDGTFVGPAEKYGIL